MADLDLGLPASVRSSTRSTGLLRLTKQFSSTGIVVPALGSTHQNFADGLVTLKCGIERKSACRLAEKKIKKDNSVYRTKSSTSVICGNFFHQTDFHRLKGGGQGLLFSICKIHIDSLRALYNFYIKFKKK
jgi:hypothetical protein